MTTTAPEIRMQCPGDLDIWEPGIMGVSRELTKAFPRQRLQMPEAEDWEKDLRNPRRPIHLHNGTSRAAAIASGAPDPGPLSISGSLNGLFKGNYDLTISLPPTDAWDLYERILVASGDRMQAHTACISPLRTAQFMLSLRQGPIAIEGRPHPQGFPVLVYDGRLSRCEQPPDLGWLNYWSADAARFIGFPRADDPHRDLAYRTPGGGWLYKIGADPLDSDVPAHLALLREAWARYPAIGVRRAGPTP
jgi:hypothetical protein